MFLALIMFLGLIPTINAEETNYRIFVDGKVVSLQPSPRIEKGSLTVPVVTLLKQLGYTTAADPDFPERVKISNSKNSITFVIGAKNIYINGKEIRMPISSQTYNGVTYLPLRSISQALGKSFGTNLTEQYVWIGAAPIKNKNFPPELHWKDFRNAIWGMSLKQVKQSETLTLTEHLTDFEDYGGIDRYYDILNYKGEYFGYKSIYHYELSGRTKTNTKLESGSIFFPERFANLQNYIDRFFSISANMEKEYGEATSKLRRGSGDQSKWAEDLSLNKLDITDVYKVGRNTYSIRLYKSLYDEYPQLSISVSKKEGQIPVKSISETQAVQLVKNKYASQIPSKTHVEVDRTEGNKYVIHVYDVVVDGPDTAHTATYFWLYVDKTTGKIAPMPL